MRPKGSAAQLEYRRQLGGKLLAQGKGVREVAGLLRESRARAGNANRPQRVVADVELNRLWVDTGETSGRVVVVPRALRMSLFTTGAEALSPARGAILTPTANLGGSRWDRMT